MTRSRRAALLVLCVCCLAGLASGALACASSLRTPCEQKCYSQRTVEPRDFDDCIQRCRK